MPNQHSSSAMEFDINIKEFPSDPTLLWEKHMEWELGNEFCIDERSPKRLFQDFQHFRQTSIDGSSTNLEFEVPSPRFDRFEDALGERGSLDHEVYNSKLSAEESDNCCRDICVLQLNTPLGEDDDEFSLDSDNSRHNDFIEKDKSCSLISKIDDSIFDTYETKPFAKGDDSGIMVKIWNTGSSIDSIDEQCENEAPSNLQEPEGINSGYPEEHSCITGDHAPYQEVDFDRCCVLMRRRQSTSHRIPRGQWTLEEDRLLMRLVDKYGLRSWSHIAQMLKGRIGKQCRERWHNHLRPDIKKETWTEEEDRILIQTHVEIGNKWAEITRKLPGRTENSIKNHWNATKRKLFTKRRCRDKGGRSNLLQNYIKGLASNSSKRGYHINTCRSFTSSYSIADDYATSSEKFANAGLIQNYEVNDGMDFSLSLKVPPHDCGTKSFLGEVACDSPDYRECLEAGKPEEGAPMREIKVEKDMDLVEMASQTIV